MEWGWNRARCEQYLRDVFGVEWKKSACVYCPFTPLRGAALERHREHPEAVADAMLLEHLSLALNPRATLYRDRSLIQITRDDRNQKATDGYESCLAALPWAIYRVRRIYSGLGKADRAVERLTTSASPTEAAAALQRLPRSTRPNGLSKEAYSTPTLSVEAKARFLAARNTSLPLPRS